MLKKISFLATFLVSLTHISLSQYEINGIITDCMTGKPLQNVRTVVSKMDSADFDETLTDKLGAFTFNFHTPGNYTFVFSANNYGKKMKTLIITESIMQYEMNIMLVRTDPHTDTIKVHSSYYKSAPDISTSYSNTKYEEIRKNPGTFEDVVKYYTTTPGVISGNDANNHLLVRGGSSFENLILIDGFEIPNPNHYGPPGSSNGALSFINAKLIGDVDFYSGGFPARYGDRVSSVMDINFREGARKHSQDINISVTGFGGFFEGPLTRKGSYMFASRKSYFELIKEQLTSDLLPEFWDFNGKLNFNISNSEKLSFTGLYVLDHAKAWRSGTSNANDTISMTLSNSSLKYTKSFGSLKASFVAGYSFSSYDARYILYDLEIKDRYFSAAQNINYVFNNFLTFDFTVGLKYYFSDYKIHHSATYNETGYYVPELFAETEVKTVKMYSGFNVTSTLPGGRLVLNTGLRIDYFGYMYHPYSVSPRAGAVFRIWDKTNIKANAGIYFQAPELAWLVTYVNNRDLDYIKCAEFVLGIEHFIGRNIQLSAEGYLKQYSNYPVSLFDPNYIFINNGVELYPNFLDEAVSEGKGYFTGIDLSIQYKNRGVGPFCKAGYSFTHSKFLALAGDYQPVEFDPVNQFNISGGFKFANGFCVSGNLKYTGGRPYTPYNMERSYQYNRGVFVDNYYNKARMPEYVRLDLRIEQELKPWNSELVMYIEVLNVFNRKNLYSYGWDYGTNQLKEYVQLYRVPVFGLSWKF